MSIPISEPFTPRETDLLPLIARCLPRKVMADTLTISIKTLDVHLKNIRRKCGKYTTAETAVFLSRYYS